MNKPASLNFIWNKWNWEDPFLPKSYTNKQKVQLQSQTPIFFLTINWYSTGVWVLWTLYTLLTTFTDSLGSWHPCQESISPRNSFDALPPHNYFLLCLLLGCPALIYCNFLSLSLKFSFGFSLYFFFTYKKKNLV